MIIYKITWSAILFGLAFSIGAFVALVNAQENPIDLEEPVASSTAMTVNEQIFSTNQDMLRELRRINARLLRIENKI